MEVCNDASTKIHVYKSLYNKDECYILFPKQIIPIPN